MKTIEMPENEGQFRNAVRTARREGVVLTERGKAVAALVPLDGSDSETLTLSSSRKFLSILRRSFQQLDSGQSVSLSEMRRRVLPRGTRKRTKRASAK